MQEFKKEFITLELEKIVPYEHNNKIHTDKDIWEIIISIEKDWYIAPTVVDEDNIILAWHWRLLALEKCESKK